jgi:hypothetical protein
MNTERVWLIVGWTMLHYLWVGAALGLGAWLARRIAERLVAPVRYAAALSCLALLAFAPVAIAWNVALRTPAAAPPAVEDSEVGRPVASEEATPAIAPADEPQEAARPVVEVLDSGSAESDLVAVEPYRARRGSPDPANERARRGSPDPAVASPADPAVGRARRGSPDPAVADPAVADPAVADPAIASPADRYPLRSVVAWLPWLGCSLHFAGDGSIV